MNDAGKTRAQLIEEVAGLRRELAALRRGQTPGRPEAAFASVAQGLQTLFDAIEDAVLAARVSDGRVVYANPRCMALLGVTEEQVLVMSFYDLMAPDVGLRVRRVVEEAMKGSRLVGPYEVQHPRGAGQTVPVRLMGGIVGDGDEAVLLLYIRDISESRQASRRLAESEERCRALLESAADCIYAVNEAGILVAINPAAARVMGTDPGALIGKTLYELFPRPIADSQMERIRSVLRTGRPASTDEHETPTAQGPRWFNTSVVPVRDAEGRIVSVLGIARDLTDRKRAEEAIRQSEARYRAVVDSQTELICRFGPGNVLTFVNESYCRCFNRQAEDLLGRSFLFLIPESDRAAAAASLDAVTPQSPVLEHEHRVTAPSGEVRWMHWVNRGFFDEHGRLTECQAVGWDITDRRRAEEALRQSEENFRTLFEQSLDGIVVLVDNRVVSANEAFAAIHGTTVSEVLGRRATDFIHPEERAAAAGRLSAAARGERLTPRDRPCRDLRADGSVVLVEARSQGIRWAGRPAVQVIMRDITQRVRLEENLREAQKMEAVGQLAGGIAHDFNNLVTGILCNVSLLKMNAESPSEVREVAGVIDGAARRAARLTNQLLGFARRGKHQDVPVDLNASVEASLNLMGRGHDPRLRILTRFAAERACVRGDPVQMEQVILNLALNARDAMPDGGTITLATDVVAICEEDCRGRAFARPGRYVVLTVSDTGPGVPEELRSRIFEPFFTTKSTGKGVGMGLAMVYGIAKNHGGWAELDAQAAPGATFRVFLPEAREMLPEPAPAAAAEPEGGPPARLLLVDDESLVRTVVCRTLSDLGYEVTVAADGRQAVDLYAASAGGFDLVIIDMVMPQMDGRECLRAIRRLDPNVRAILSTGGGDDRAVRALLEEGGVGFVQKPYQAEDLANAVRLALGR
jgi:PAS domain S-box-containing protein